LLLKLVLVLPDLNCNDAVKGPSATPLISKYAPGDVVPIPTLPVLVIRAASVPDVPNIKAAASLLNI